MHVDAGKLSKRIQFLRKTTAKDADGYDVPGEPQPVRETWAQFSQTSGTELIRANAEFGEAKVRFLTRADPALLARRSGSGAATTGATTTSSTSTPTATRGNTSSSGASASRRRARYDAE